jgi:hypothetical protein
LIGDYRDVATETKEAGPTQGGSTGATAHALSFACQYKCIPRSSLDKQTPSAFNISQQHLLELFLSSPTLAFEIINNTSF